MLKDITIKSLASDIVYKRGRNYYQAGEVTELTALNETQTHWSAVVMGTKPYEVEVRLDKSGNNVEGYSCECPAAAQYLGACKHIVAVLLAIQDEQELNKALGGSVKDNFARLGITTARDLLQHTQKKKEQEQSLASQRMFSFFREAAQADKAAYRTGAAEFAHLVPRLFIDEYYGSYRRWLEFRFGVDKLYVVKSAGSFVESMENGKDWQLGTKNVVNLAQVHWGDEQSAKIYALMKKYFRAEQGMFAAGSTNHYYYMSYHSYLFDQKQFRLSEDALAEFLEIMGDSPFELRLNGAELETVRTVPGNPHIELELRENKGGGELVVQETDMVPLDDNCRFIYQEGIIYQTEKKFSQGLKPLLRTFEAADTVKIRSQDMAAFFGKVLPQMEKAAEVKIAPKFMEEYVVHPLSAELYIDYEGDGIAVRPKFAYGDAVFNPLVETEPPLRDGRKLVRDENKENEILMRLTHYDFRKKRDQLVQRDEEKSYEFLTEELPNLP
ncbi:MAG: SNF2 helicase associated domain-containing protein, partial [Selenomonas sp.]|nr:SNF2 helicase associated domain-containing protein [Selenomonas sp.]